MNLAKRRIGYLGFALFVAGTSARLLPGFDGPIAGLIANASATTIPEKVLASSAADVGSVHRFDHVVIAIMENTGYSSIIGNTIGAPYINSLLATGASFNNAHGVTHPSQPNYLALFPACSKASPTIRARMTLSAWPILAASCSAQA